MRVADEFKVFTNVFNSLVDPKRFDPRSFVDIKADHIDIPPNSFALARSVELFHIPRNVLAICLGKCLTGDTRIVDGLTGDYITIADFIQRQSSQTVALKGWRMRRSEVSEHVFSGQQPVYRLTTRSGSIIKATASHPFRTIHGWTALQDLHIGARIAVARRCEIFGKQHLPEHEALLLGFMLSDGQCSTPGHSPRYTSGDHVLQECFTKAAHAFGCEVSHVGKYGINLINHRGRGGIPEMNRAYKWLRSLDCDKHSEDKFVPSVIFRAPRESVATFLRALFSGDGSIHQSGDSVHLEYYSISKRLAEDVRHLLLRFGIFAVLKSKAVWNGTRIYRVAMTDKDMIRLFAQHIGFIPESMKQRRLEEILEYITLVPKQKSNFDTLPPEVWKQVQAALITSGRTLRNVAGVNFRSANQQSLPYTIAQNVAQATQDEELLALVDSDVLWDTVASIELVGVEPVYDITIPDAHNFLANGFVVHNSTYARCGLVVNTTPFEPGWRGYVTLELTNSTPLPARIYANEGIAQVLFFESDEECEVAYSDRNGKYMDQVGVVPPRMFVNPPE
ncbi:MAG: hypothetical protein H7Z42_06525 [Roseiflexaceae bacterium]|nr:hypothetical protein [Roseiflexaceae bacterium]